MDGFCGEIVAERHAFYLDNKDILVQEGGNLFSRAAMKTESGRSPLRRNLLYLTCGLAVAGLGLAMGALLAPLVFRVLALSLSIPAGAWMAIGLCRLARPVYYSVGFPPPPRALQRQASLRDALRATKSWLVRPVGRERVPEIG